jgi:hypothetical protein
MNPTQTLGQDSTPRCRAPHEVIHYPGPGILVTGRCIHVEDAWFPLDELGGFTEEKGVDGAFVMGCLAGAVAIAGVAAGVLAAGTGGALTESIVLAVLFSAATALVAAGFMAHERRVYQLWARHRGSRVLLYSTPDRHRFRAVVRALRRAWQDLDET